MITKKQERQIERFARSYYETLDVAHGIAHAFKTVKLAENIAKKEHGNVKICVLGALLHQFHDVSKVKAFLKRIDLEKDAAEQLTHIVAVNHLKNIHKAKSLEAKIVYDADKLQCLGPEMILRQTAYWSDSKNRDYGRALDLRTILKILPRFQARYYKSLQTGAGKKLGRRLYAAGVKALELMRYDRKTSRFQK